MCGICGIVSASASTRIDVETLLRMRDTLIHRGPDDSGIYLGLGAGLGHRRLSIIDLRPEGRQPIANEDGTIRIVFNGEIYNFVELRADLEQRGHRFRSDTDTEVIVHLYEEYGPRCVERLRGMFAFAIWDEPKRTLMLARDRAGKKPLYYAIDGEQLLFGSEAKAIVAHGAISAEPDYRALNYYLTYGYVPGEHCGFKQIRKLPPAHYLIYQSGRVELTRYWRLSYLPKLKISEREACEELRRRLREAVKMRMVADVPLGAFLSGGVDSSAIVALMSELGSRPVKTFSIGFRQRDYDETRWARMVAEKFHTEHHEFIVEPQDDPQDAAQLLSTLARHYDEPYADSSAIATYYLSKLTREHVTVALNGDGGDENFAGYKRHSVTAMANYLEPIPPSIRKLMGAAISHGYSMTGGNRRIAVRLRMLGDTMNGSWRSGYGRMLAWFSEAEKARLCSPEFAAAVGDSPVEEILARAYEDADADDAIDQTLSVDVSLYLPEDCLVKVDRASMAASLEARSPLVDHEFMEFAAHLPARFKLNLYDRKLIFKKAFRGILPDAILKRPKMGFGVPLDYWFRGATWIEILRDILLSRRAFERGYFRRAEVETLIDDHVAGKSDRHSQLWMLLMLEMWHRTFIDGELATDYSSNSHLTAIQNRASA